MADGAARESRTAGSAAAGTKESSTAAAMAIADSFFMESV